MRLASRMRAGLKGIREYLYWISLFLILSIVFLAIILIPALLTIAGPQVVPYALHSVLFADYSIDPHVVKHSRLRLDVIAQVVKDQLLTPSGEAPGLNLALGTPVPSVTPLPGVGSTPNPELQKPTPTRRPTDTIPGPTTSSQEQSPTPTLHSTPFPEETQQPSRTPVSNSPTRTPTMASATQPGNTHQSPTKTPPVGNPSRTPMPPTSTRPPATKVPSSTAVAPTPRPPTSTSPPPTSIPVPPTRTPAPTDPPPADTPRPTKTKDPYPPPPYP